MANQDLSNASAMIEATIKVLAQATNFSGLSDFEKAFIKNQLQQISRATMLDVSNMINSNANSLEF